MSTDDGIFVDEKKRQVSEGHIEAVDRLYWDPRERAMGVLAIIENVRESVREENEEKNRPREEGVPSNWDILCFAVEHVAQMSVALDGDELTPLARRLASWLYSTHYSYPSKIYGAPDRPKGKKKTEEDPTVDLSEEKE